MFLILRVFGDLNQTERTQFNWFLLDYKHENSFLITNSMFFIHLFNQLSFCGIIQLLTVIILIELTFQLCCFPLVILVIDHSKEDLRQLDDQRLFRQCYHCFILIPFLLNDRIKSKCMSRRISSNFNYPLSKPIKSWETHHPLLNYISPRICTFMSLWLHFNQRWVNMIGSNCF